MTCGTFPFFCDSLSVSDILQLYEEDAEEVLCALGFGSAEEQITARVPSRFLNSPSNANGINLRLFLDSQIQRIREEDHRLCLASRFRQVEVLTATANAFYSLYSHVSRTPLQKLDTPVFTFPSPVNKMKRFQPSTCSEPRSPVERLKDTVHRMCLYTGSPRGSESTSPQPLHRKRSSVPDIVEMIMRDNFVVCICVLSVCLGTFNQSIPKDPPQRSRPLTMLNVSSSVSASLVLRRSTGTSCIRDNILAAAFLLANFLEVPLPGEITTEY
uniref:ITPR-interacting domain-containing protein n=1 Tax=Oryzias latipes TaxID=8090 RepID=A0A3P9HXR8_ORYLA